MVEPFAWSSGMAMVLIANPLQQPLCNGLVEGTGKGFCFREKLENTIVYGSVADFYTHPFF